MVFRLLSCVIEAVDNVLMVQIPEGMEKPYLDRETLLQNLDCLCALAGERKSRYQVRILRQCFSEKALAELMKVSEQLPQSGAGSTMEKLSKIGDHGFFSMVGYGIFSVDQQGGAK